MLRRCRRSFLSTIFNQLRAQATPSTLAAMLLRRHHWPRLWLAIQITKTEHHEVKKRWFKQDYSYYKYFELPRILLLSGYFLVRLLHLQVYTSPTDYLSTTSHKYTIIMSTGVGMSKSLNHASFNIPLIKISGSCCLSGSVHEGNPVGTVETIGELPTYVSAPKDGSKAKTVIFLVDSMCPQTRLHELQNSKVNSP